MKNSIVAFVASGILLAIASCASYKPGDPAHAWANGTWNGVDSRYDRTFQMEVVDGNKIIGTMTNCGKSGTCGSGPLNGSVEGDVITVTGTMRSGSYDFTLRRVEGDDLRTRGIILKKRK
jgi:hypothetical protein